MRWSRTGVLVVGLLGLVGLLAGVYGTPAATSQATTLNVVRAMERPDLDPDWRLWTKISGVDVPITAQTITYPNGGGSVPSVNLKGVYHEGVLYLRVTWNDSTADDQAVAVDQFTDAMALEFPAKSAVTVPSFCMGQPNALVNIWQWRASGQTGDPAAGIARLYPNGYADGYPDVLEKDPIYQPARALANPVAAFGETPVENLVAQAFGTLAPATDQSVKGKGVWRDGEWSVVFARPFAGADPSQATFDTTTRTNMAVAVWNGSEGDRNGQKSVSQFVTLSVSGAALIEGSSNDWNAIWIGLLLGGGTVLAGLAIMAWVGMRSFGKRRA